MLKESPAQILPLFTETVGDGLTITCRVCWGLAMQVLLATTVKTPLEPARAEIVFVMLVPLQPAGKFQEYDVAAGSFMTE